MIRLFLSCLLLLAACTPGSKEHHHEEATSTDDPNGALTDQVMAIHDEVMPRLEDIFKLKQNLQEQLTSKDLAEARKTELNNTIARLDSASGAMMSWMHGFNPPADTVEQEKAREYLEEQMERIRQIKEQIAEAIEAGEQQKKP